MHNSVHPLCHLLSIVQTCLGSVWSELWFLGSLVPRGKFPSRAWSRFLPKMLSIIQACEQESVNADYLSRVISHVNWWSQCTLHDVMGCIVPHGCPWKKATQTLLVSSEACGKCSLGFLFSVQKAKMQLSQVHNTWFVSVHFADNFYQRCLTTWTLSTLCQRQHSYRVMQSWAVYIDIWVRWLLLGLKSTICNCFQRKNHCWWK